MSAWLMAIFFQGLSQDELNYLTQTMLNSGTQLDFSHVPQKKVDKHSTGGVGDKTSLILGPIVAAAGLMVPMISGRGLGHTGGTLDKLEAIPGFSTRMDLKRFKELIEIHNLIFMGQTGEICPADKKMYALRDVTGTVESIPLICASIMSKKLAEGIDGLVLDVKYGSGAFMKDLASAEKIATALCRIGWDNGKEVIALITSMNQPLGRFVGNALEVKECLEILQGSQKYPDTAELSLELAGYMLWLGAVAASPKEGRQRAESLLSSGKAYEKFCKICDLQGGNLQLLPTAKQTKSVLSNESGFLTKYEAESIGIASLALGAGRVKTSDSIDPTAGIEIHKKIGDAVEKGEQLFTLYSANPERFSVAESILNRSFLLGEQKPVPYDLIAKIISKPNQPLKQ